MSIVFAILALVSALVGTVLFGIIGGGVALIFAVLSIVFAAKKKKTEGGGGTASIVISIIALVFGCLLSLVFIGVSGVIKEEAQKADAPIVEKYADDLKFGVLGFVLSAASDDVDMDEFSDQLKKVTDSM